MNVKLEQHIMTIEGVEVTFKPGYTDKGANWEAYWGNNSVKGGLQIESDKIIGYRGHNTPVETFGAGEADKAYNWLLDEIKGQISPSVRINQLLTANS